ncbi:MAG: polyribonucleotide nucleotidyltransferase [Pseudomonadota bacterium]|nr:polyribonucleotide nucleotidyltransferase [Pseudomonadota bacterium]
MISPYTKTFQYGSHKVSIKTGHIATQTEASVWLTMGDCVIMVNVTRKPCQDDRDFFPLTVHYIEKFFANGKIPGGFTRREGRPSEREVIICRLIDRSIRPMFPKSFKDEIQINVSLLQHDSSVEPDIAAMLASSAALALCDVPYTPIASARVGLVNDNYVLNPTKEQATFLDLVMSSTQESCIMIESESEQLSEDQIIQAVAFGHEKIQAALTAIIELKADRNPNATAWNSTEEENVELQAYIDAVNKQHSDQIIDALAITQKSKRNDAMSQARESITKAMLKQVESSDVDVIRQETLIKQAISAIEKQHVRTQILNQKPRLDGRRNNEIRPIDCQISVLPKGPHGSAIFTRGETQALVTVTLGSDSDAQLLDEVAQSGKDHFMLQYIFPPYCVGECGMPSSPKRREIGHGRLARKAIQPVLPKDNQKFAHTLRIVSEILSSNGSSSMATVCGTSLALMDTGVPIQAAVSGIAMGLIVEGSNFAVLSDILGDEDHLGDMDFKVAGTQKGITALQMDLKIKHLDLEIFKGALHQARDGRLHILNEMNKTIQEPRQEMASHAPQMTQFNISPNKISVVIGRGGATIKDLIEKFNVTIDINDDGLVKVSGKNKDSIHDAKHQIEALALELKAGDEFEGKISKILEFGAFVTIAPGKDAFLHISQIAQHRIENIHDELSQDQIIRVKITEVDEKQQRCKVTMKNVPQHS